MDVQGETFQKQHSKFFKIAMVCAFYPPGIEIFVQSKVFRIFLWCYSSVPLLLALPYILTQTYFVFSPESNSVILRVQIFRRALLSIYMACQLGSHMLRFSTISELFNRWNNVINKDYCVAERKLILERLTKGVRYLLIIGISRFIISQWYTGLLWFDRHVKFAEFAGVPHDVESPYHFYYVAYQAVYFFWIGAPHVVIELLYCFVMSMTEAEIAVLKNKLADILSTISVSEDKLLACVNGETIHITDGSTEYKNAVERVNRELWIWIKAHQTTKKWLDDLKDFLHLFISIKYLYLVVHCSLVVIGTTIKAGSYNDFIVILMFTVTNMAFSLYATVQADRLHDDSERLFLEAYGRGWYLYPVSTQKILSIIATVTQARPQQFYGLKILLDSKENFSAVLQMAYQVLTFVLPMAKS